MAKFGNNGSCYWKILETKEEALNTWQGTANEDYVSKSIDSGLALLINSSGGYHCAKVLDLKDVHEGKDFPKLFERIKVLLGEVKKNCQEGEVDKAMETLDLIIWL